NTGILAAPAARLKAWLGAIKDDNAQGEFYLTDVIGLAVAQGASVSVARAPTPVEVMGVNDRVQLAELERAYQRRRAEELMLGGATLRDPARVDVRGEVSVGRDVIIDVNVILEGKVVLGDGVQVGPNTVIRNAEIEAGTVVLAHCTIEDSHIGPGCQIGPFARLRPGVQLAENVRVGNFVEIKNSRLGAGSKSNHLTYIGDTHVGDAVNVGAGTIVCNYDGANKHRTVIGDRAFIGSGVELVAPVTVREGATIAAGSTITSDAPPDKLTIARARQTTLDGWRRPVKKKS
ncbi:MAG: bifunctional UDP-N-acetylglucosamine diphosphorylase/glucosamine-1-phosphate N-acetyltransferase GlmU, partial [Gammaproteobacteria bacterium]